MMITQKKERYHSYLFNHTNIQNKSKYVIPCFNRKKILLPLPVEHSMVRKLEQHEPEVDLCPPKPSVGHQ